MTDEKINDSEQLQVIKEAVKRANEFGFFGNDREEWIRAEIYNIMQKRNIEALNLRAKAERERIIKEIEKFDKEWFLPDMPVSKDLKRILDQLRKGE